MQLPKIRYQYELLQSDEDKIKVLLDRNDAINLIKLLEKRADETANDIKISINDDIGNSNLAAKNKKTESELVSSLPSQNYLILHVELLGNYNSIYSFIKSLENDQYYSDMISFDISQKMMTQAGLTNSVLDPFRRAQKSTLTAQQNDAKSQIIANLDIAFYTN